MNHLPRRPAWLLIFILIGCSSSGIVDDLPMKNTPESVAMNYVLGVNYMDIEKIEFALGETVVTPELKADLRKFSANLNKQKFPAVVRRAGNDLAKFKVVFVDKFEDALAMALISYWPISAAVLYDEPFRSALMQSDDKQSALQTAQTHIRNKHGSVDQARSSTFLVIPLVKAGGRWYPMLDEVMGDYASRIEADYKKRGRDEDWADRADEFLVKKELDFNVYARGSFIGPAPPYCDNFFCSGALNLQDQALADRGKF